jgi:hypothetical protein
MQITITRRMAVTAVVVLSLVGAGGAIAASGHSSNSNATAARQGCGPGAAGGPRAPGADAIASYLGVTKAELRTARENGTSLAQLAQQQGKSVDGLKQAIYNDAKAHLDKAVAAGRITSAQAASMLSNLQSHLDDIVNSTGPPPGPGPRMPTA